MPTITQLARKWNNIFSEKEKLNIIEVYQYYYQKDIFEILKENEVVKSIFMKLNFIDKEDIKIFVTDGHITPLSTQSFCPSFTFNFL